MTSRELEAANRAAMDWSIRPALAADAAELSALAERTFRDAFSAANTAQDMDAHCAAAYRPQVQAAEIANPHLHTLVASSDGQLVGFAQLQLRSNVPDCVPASKSVELRRIYVDRPFHGSGLANDLMRRALEAAVAHGAIAVWLGVWERNPRAIRFYQRHGFVAAGEHVFVLGNDAQRDLVMVRAVALAADRTANDSRPT